MRNCFCKLLIGEVMSIGFWVFVVTFITVVVSFYNRWLMAKGRLSTLYPFMIVESLLFLIINTYVSLSSPHNLGLFLYHTLGIWGIIMGIQGMRRLKKGQGSR